MRMLNSKFHHPRIPPRHLFLVADEDHINYGVGQPGEEYPGGKPLIPVDDFVVALDGLNARGLRHAAVATG